MGHTAAGSKEENDNYTGLLRFKIWLLFNIIVHAALSSDGHIVGSVVGDSDLCRDGLHSDW